MRPPKIDVPTAPVVVEVQKVPGQPWIGGDLARRFWLPVAGPSLFLFTAAMSELDGQTVDVLDVARSVGIGRKTLPRGIAAGPAVPSGDHLRVDSVRAGHLVSVVTGGGRTAPGSYRRRLPGVAGLGGDVVTVTSAQLLASRPWLTASSILVWRRSRFIVPVEVRGPGGDRTGSLWPDWTGPMCDLVHSGHFSNRMLRAIAGVRQRGVGNQSWVVLADNWTHIVPSAEQAVAALDGDPVATIVYLPNEPPC